jgi:hypothetical protein
MRGSGACMGALALGKRLLQIPRVSPDKAISGISNDTHELEERDVPWGTAVMPFAYGDRFGL